MAIKIHSRHCQRVGFLLVLWVVVSGTLAAQQNAESSKADHRTIRGSSEAVAPWLVSSDQGLAVIGAALESRKHMDPNADCSNLVHAIYERAGFTYSYSNSSELYRGIKEFRRILHPQPGDLVVWRGHVGIVISPVQHSFFSAMRSGRGVEFYDSPYWQARGRPRFFRYLKAASRTQFSASARNANLIYRKNKNLL
jgi:cell wall-associated NlpC family hydrolase